MPNYYQPEIETASREQIKAWQDSKGFILLAPHCKKGDWNEWMNLLIRLVSEVRELPYIDETHIHLTGNSMGGYGTWQLAISMPEAFAAIREAAWRVLGMRPYPVQLIGGIVLHQGRIAEMKTGEGKTLVAILPCYLNALTGRGVHVVTVNDYLAKRDSEWMGKVHRYMGLTVGLVIPGMNSAERREAYAADIT